MCTGQFAGNVNNFIPDVLAAPRPAAGSPAKECTISADKLILKHHLKRCLIIATLCMDWCQCCCCFLHKTGAAPAAKATFEVMSQLCCGCKSSNS